MGNIENVDYGVCGVSYNGVDLGHTSGGVVVSYEQKTEDVVVDQYGSTPVDKIFAGENVEVTLKLAEYTLANLAVGMPKAEHETGAEGSRLEFGANAGSSLGDVAYVLRLHPIKNAAGVLDDDLVFYKAVAIDKVELAFEVDKQRQVEVTMACLIDETKSEGNRLGHIGVDSIS